MKRRVLVIGGRPLVLATARTLGMQVAHVQRPGEFPLKHQWLSEESLLLDYTEVDRMLPVVRAWHATYPFSQAISLTEDGLMPAAVVRDALQLGGTPAAVTGLLRDKAAMRARLARSELASVPFAVCHDLDDVHAFAREHGYPIIIKPIDGVRSHGVYRIPDHAHAGAAVDRIHADGYQSFLAESFINGRELSVESISCAGVHRVVAITEVFSNDLHMETGHVTPARITAAEAMSIRGYVEDFLATIGLVDGPSHTQLFLTADRGPVVIESHDRIGLDQEFHLVWRSYGHHLVELTLGLPAGMASMPDPLQWVDRKATAIWFVMGGGGRLTSVSGAAAARSSPGVVDFDMAREERLIGRLCAPNDRLGHAIATGHDADHALDQAKAAANRVKLTYEP